MTAEQPTRKTWVPTRKWMANAVSVLAGWLVAAIQNDWVINTELQITAVGIGAGLLGSYILSNENTPGGVPRTRTVRSSWGRRNR
jgi:hypothetical protein